MKKTLVGIALLASVAASDSTALTDSSFIDYHAPQQEQTEGNLYMKGSVFARGNCPECKNPFQKINEVFICKDCGTLPSKFGIYVYRSEHGDLRIYSHDGVPFMNQKHANRILERIRSEIDDGTFDVRDYQPKKLDGLRFDTYASAWLTHYEKKQEKDEISKSYLQSLTNFTNNYFIPFFGNKDIRRINNGDIVKFQDQLPSRLKLKTQRNIMGALSKLFADAHEWEDIAKKPKVPLVKVPDPEWHWIDRDTQDKILAKIPEPDQPIFLFLMREGVRSMEGAALQWRDLDIENNSAIIRRAFSGSKLRHTKTGRTTPIPLDEDVKMALLRLPKPIKQDQLVFRNSCGRRYTNSLLNKIWKRACKKAGIEGICLYSGTRHALASQAAQRGISIQKIGAMLGHSDIRTTMRYAHLDTNALREIVLKPEQKKADVVPIRKEKG